MSRRSDPFWCHVEKTAGGFRKCVFCGTEFTGSTSITRIKYHLARVKGGGVKQLCEKVTPDVQRAAFDQLPNRMHGSMPSSSNNIIVTAGSDRAQDLEMQGQPLLDDDLSTLVDSLILPMPDAPETGLGTEPADQPFEMDMSNISSSLMQSVVERGSSSKRPVDRSMPSSSNNEATNAASTPVRALAIEQEGQPLLDSLIWGENLVTEPADQPFEMDMSNISYSLMQSVVERGSSSKRPVDRSMPSSSNNEATNAASTLVRALAIEQEGQPLLDSLIWGENLVTEPADQPFEMDMSNISSSLMQSVVERGSSSKRPVDRSMPSSSNNEATNAASTPVRALAIEQEGQPLLDSLIWGENLVTEPADQPFEMDMSNISSLLMQSVVERGSSSKRPVDRSMPSSSNNEATNAASTPVRALAIEQEGQPLLDSLIWGENLVTDAASTPFRGLAIEQPLLDDGLGGMEILIGGETELVEEPRGPVVLMTDEPEPRQRTEQAHQSFEMNTKSISSSSMMDDVLRMCRDIMSQEYKHSVVERGSSSESPAHKQRRTRRYFLPTTKLVGQAFERNMNDVWSWLLNDEVSSIGIYGMGGVGKTAFSTHIHNQLRHVCQERQDIFHHVCWITVSQDFSIEALQDCIVEYFDLDLGDQKDAVVRAGKLWTELTVKKKYVLILDDLWDHFPLEKVGIPLRTDGCKLIFTTRSLDICTKMDCQRIIKVEPLSEGEAWNLFVEKLGHGVRLFPETKQIAESVVKECAGLPLGIMTMAGSMKGVESKYRWRDALQRLRISEVGPSDMETEVFRVLEFSYAQLNDPALQKCFLHITLLPKGKIILREDLIEYLIDEGIVEELWTRYEQFDRGHTMLDQLENASLLEGSWDDENYRYVKMHDLIWDMARRINTSLGRRVQAGAQLTELPDETWWRENLLIVSLMENRIKEIPSDFSPRCPNLSTLLLCRNYKLNLVESSFFQHFIRLKVLDLSDTDIEKLPGSICHLRRLTVLLLGWCAKLSYVPSLAKLTALKKLDLSYTGLRNLPEGVERLKDLRYLNFDGSVFYGQRVAFLRPGIFSKLSKLQFLKIGGFFEVRGHEVLSLRKLETLECNFSDLEGCMQLFGSLPSLIACKVTVGRRSFSLLEDLNYTKSKVKEAWFYYLMFDDASFLSKIPLTKAVFVNCYNMRILSPLMDGYRRLEILHLDGLMILQTLFEAPSNRFPLPPFCCLKEIVILQCHRMKVLLPPWLLSTLRLEVIVVEDCHNMLMIMETDEDCPTWKCSESLKVLVLKKLPELNSIYSGRLECNSLEEITVNDCPQLTRIPLTIPHSLKKNQVDPGIWWDCDLL